MMTINFEQLYTSLTEQFVGRQKKIAVNSSLGVYFGISPEGYMRLSFMSSCPAPKLESTRTLQVSQGEESNGVFWTCFDLLQPDSKKVFYTFCGNLVESVAGTIDEYIALQNLKRRYITWKSMFRKVASSGMPHAVLQGLFGELYFLKNYMLKEYGISTAIQAWGGSDALNKDFSCNDNWFEVKTIGANAVKVQITSLAQLASETVGRLVIVRVEQMSKEFTGIDSSIEELLKSILTQSTDEALEESFLSKLSSLGIHLSDDCLSTKFDVKSLHFYTVDCNFPRLTVENIQHPEICDVQYSLIVNSLDKYMEA